MADGLFRVRLQALVRRAEAGQWDGMADDPFTLFEDWLAEARLSEPNDHNAMTLATADAAGRPSARMVLLGP